MNPRLVRQLRGVHALLERLFPEGYALHLELSPDGWIHPRIGRRAMTMLTVTTEAHTDRWALPPGDTVGSGLRGLSRAISRLRYCALWRLYERGAVSKPPRQSKAAA